MANHKIEIRRRNIEKILQAAEKVFAEKGYGATSMGDIAEQAALPRSNLHYYFSTKDELLGALNALARRIRPAAPSVPATDLVLNLRRLSLTGPAASVATSSSTRSASSSLA